MNKIANNMIEETPFRWQNKTVMDFSTKAIITFWNYSSLKLTKLMIILN